ncbi:Leucine-rich repeat-containing protein 9 [Durusdinium trenchii]|uniref:Leucine-rich repeat-containing protein 9 n=1 Tax=Durusdinium trenchii TaxID=1381693 RepID=A0ABP0RLA4_9DINO
MVRHDELMSGQILQQEKTQSDLSARDCHLMDVLWLAGNQLRSLEGLDLPNLTELNAAFRPKGGASNELSSVVGAFDELPQLKTLNLAGNRLCSFKEVLDLARRNSLTALSFADPDFGENPICTLCNYQTYILYHLPKLQVHDQMYVDAEAHQVAQAAYAKKRLEPGHCSL